MVGSGLFTLLKVEFDKIWAAPCEGCLRTLVEEVNPLRSSYVSCSRNRAFIWV